MTSPLMISLAAVVVIWIFGLGGVAVWYRRQAAVAGRLEQLTRDPLLQAPDEKKADRKPSALTKSMDQAFQRKGWYESVRRELARADLKLSVAEFLALHVILAIAGFLVLGFLRQDLVAGLIAGVIEPDSVTLRGNPMLIESINRWLTSPLRLTDITKPFRVEVPLVDSLNNHLVMSPQVVTISGDIQQTAEQTFDDIPVEILSAPLRSDHTLLPARISITVRGGTEQLAQLDARQFRATVDYSQLSQDSSGIVLPAVSMPPSLRLLSTSPPYLRHKKVMVVRTDKK